MMNEPVLGGMAQTTLDRREPLLRVGNTNCGGCGLSSLMQMMRHAVPGMGTDTRLGSGQHRGICLKSR